MESPDSVEEQNVTYFEAREEVVQSFEGIVDVELEETPPPKYQTAVEMAIDILRQGQDIQKISVIRNLPDFFENQTDESLVKIFPLVQATLRNETKNLDLHCEGTIAYRNVLVEKSTTGEFNVVSEILKGILINLEEPSDSLSAAAWLETLVDVVDHISVESVKSQVVPTAINQCCHQSVQRRVISTKLLERLATKLSSQEVKSELVPSVQALCQDASATVRTSMCQRLPIIAAALSMVDSAAFVLPCLIELCNDEDSAVKEAAMESVGRCMISFDKATSREIVIPLLRKCSEYSLRMADSTLPIVAKNIGPWCYTLQDILSEQDKSWFATLFIRLASFGQTDNETNHLMTRSDPEGFSFLTSNIDADPYQTACRCWCAYNFPGMVLIFGAKIFTQDLLTIYSAYCRDADENVKKSIAAGFHEMVKLVKDLDVSCLIPCFVDLIKTCDAEIVSLLAPKFGLFLPLFYGSCALTDTDANGNVLQSTYHIQLDRILMACNRLIRNDSNWRCHESFLNQLSCLTTCLSYDDIHATFVPLLKEEILTARAIPCRLAAVRTLLLFLRETPSNMRRMSVIDFFIQTLCRHQSCHKRILYLQVCVQVMELFSRQFFKKYFLPHALKLCDDNVSNVRLKLCQLLKSFKTTLVLPKDEPQLAKFETVIKGLLSKDQTQYHRQSVQLAAQQFSRVETGLADDPEEQTKLEDEQKRFGLKPEPVKEPTPEPIKPNLPPSVTSRFEHFHEPLKPIQELPKAVREPFKPIELPQSVQELPNSVEEVSEQVEKLPNSVEEVTKPVQEPTKPPAPPTTAERIRGNRFRVHRPRTAIVRPQPQITITERAPSPRPTTRDIEMEKVKETEEKDMKDEQYTKKIMSKSQDERSEKSKSLKPPAPVSRTRRIGLSETTNRTGRYQLTATVSNVSRQDTHSNTLPRTRPSNKDSNANVRLSSNSERKFPTTGNTRDTNNNGSTKTSIPVATSTLSFPRRSSLSSSNRMSNSNSSDLRSSSSTIKRNPYSLVKVQSSSAIEQKSRNNTGNR